MRNRDSLPNPNLSSGMIDDIIENLVQIDINNNLMNDIIAAIESRKLSISQLNAIIRTARDVRYRMIVEKESADLKEVLPDETPNGV